MSPTTSVNLTKDQTPPAVTFFMAYDGTYGRDHFVAALESYLKGVIDKDNPVEVYVTTQTNEVVVEHNGLPVDLVDNILIFEDNHQVALANVTQFFF